VVSEWTFTWDLEKAARNIRKHRVEFSEAATAFEDPLGRFFPDADDPAREILIARSARQRLLVTVFVEVDVRARLIRIISARKATAHELKDYEEG
jgi:uncharacterized DUF497 family protein